MTKVNELTPQYNLESLGEDVFTGERRMILDLLEINYPNWIYQEDSNSVAYEIKDYILKSEVQDVLTNLENYGVDATLVQLIEILKTK